MWKLSLNPRPWFEYRFQRFLKRSIPRQDSIQLRQKNLFIFPNMNGWAFVLAGILIWLLGTNYDNNLALSLAFFIAALFLVTIYHTFNNLHHLQLKFIKATPVFSGELAQIQLQIIAGNSDRLSVKMHWPGGNKTIHDFNKGQQDVITLYVPTKHRGWYRPPRLNVESTYPVGLWRCWTLLDLDVKILTYPKPMATKHLPHTSSDDREGQLQAVEGGEDFHGLRAFRIGDSLKHVSWKHYAQGRGLHTKNYSDFLDSRIWLDWDLLPGLDREARLSRLTFLAIEAEKSKDEYGLRIPGIEIKPSRGNNHLLSVLKTLALFEQPNPTEAESSL